jgi:6-pyruvoyltetrahydropterin/6-carboxytetrahydropterin synthase
MTDGGSRGNPGPAGGGFAVYVDCVEIYSGQVSLGVATNNVAEYGALIAGLRAVLEHFPDVMADGSRLVIQADSQLMVRQLTGVYKVKSADLKPLFLEAQSLLRRVNDWTAEHVRRELNARADELANAAMDAAQEPGPAETQQALLLSVDTDQTEEEDLVSDIAPAHTPQPEAAAAAVPADATGTYELTIKSHFDAAHHLYDYPGPCRQLHGHTWDIEVSVVGSRLNDIGIVYDFKQLKDDLNGVLDAYDHTDLNTVAPFDVLSPTAENLARVIYERMAAAVDPVVRVSQVTVWESPAAKLVYRP